MITLDHLHKKYFFCFFIINIFLIRNINSIDTVRYAPFSSYFNNPYDYADAESYSVNLFTSLYKHMNDVKREPHNCKNIPLPKTVLNQKYFNPSYEFMQYKYWYPPRDHQYVMLWSQYESYRNSLFLSYMLQDDNAQFPPGWLYLYLSTAAQLHSLQMIGFNSHKIIKAIKLPFESNEVFKVNWWAHGNFQKFEKPFAIYASQPKPNEPKLVRVIDFGTGDYSNDYTGHAFLPSYLYDRQKHLLNNTVEVSNFWKKPVSGGSFQADKNSINPNDFLYPEQQRQLEYLYKQYNNNQKNNQQTNPSFQQPYPNNVDSNKANTFNQNYNYNNQYYQNQEFYDPKSSINQPKVNSIDEFSSYVYVHKNSIPIKDWDPLVDNDRTNLNRVPDRSSPIGFDQWYINTISENIAMENIKTSDDNPFIFKNLNYIDTYRFAKVWWSNESSFMNNKQEYVFRIKPEERYYKFTGAKFETGTSWTSPYFWCVDPTNWLVTAKTPIWASNDYYYKNKIFFSKEIYRFVGLSEVVLNYEEADVNQCPGDRQLNAFSSTSLCDSTTECLPLPYYGLKTGGYECQCISNYYYPYNVQGPYKGPDLNNQNIYPLCHKSEGLLQYPNWISKNAIENPVPNIATSSFDRNYNFNLKKRDLNSVLKISNKQKIDPLVSLHKLIEDSKFQTNFTNNDKKKKRNKRFIDKRNNFEKLRDSIFVDQDSLKRKCAMMPFQDILLLNEDDERFILNLRNHANQVFKPQMSQAIRIAHILSSYIQLHSPFGSSSINSQNDFASFKNVNGLRPDPQLEEYIIIGEIMSTLISNHPLQEVNVFFNGTEYERQKFFSNQNTLGFGLSMIRSDIELLLNKSNDNSHLKKSWYLDAINRFMYGNGKTNFGGLYATDEEKRYYQSAGPFDNNFISNGFRLDRYGIEMNIRRSFEGLNGNVEIPPKFYDAASSGIWFGPYYDCQKRYMKTKTTLRMTYSVPIITSMNKLPVGFVSINVGSDLKWWKINPCDTSKERNMFQGIHKCDQETTICQEQNVPEFENGFYLASYKCICKANYEFPFIDYGSSYFEGGTVEKEYDKRMKGLPNIYDRLKCRPIMQSTSMRSGYLSSANSSFKFFNFIYYFNLFFVLRIYF